MMACRLGASALVAWVFATAIGAQAPVSALLPDEAIRKILVERIDTSHQSVGIVVGVIEPRGRRVVTYGKFTAGDPRRLSGDTLFEIGSVTKVFTALLLTDAVQRQEVSLNDPVVKFLPASVAMPERGGRAITLRDLANHTSALPRVPGNISPKDTANPYADYSVEQLYQALSKIELSRDIGSQYEYSNLGVGLLGHVLARRAGMDYESLVRKRVLEPLGMTSTTVTLAPAMKARLAPGHNAELRVVPNWDIPTLAGAGALRSSANDMLSFLAAFLGYTKSPLASAMAAMTAKRWPTGAPNREIALGWHIFTANDREIMWHNGGTGGYRTFIGYDPRAGTGVVVLSNAGTLAGQDDLGRYLLDPLSPLRASP